jgi:hypothetical protein
MEECSYLDVLGDGKTVKGYFLTEPGFEELAPYCEATISGADCNSCENCENLMVSYDCSNLSSDQCATKNCGVCAAARRSIADASLATSTPDPIEPLFVDATPIAESDAALDDMTPDLFGNKATTTPPTPPLSAVLATASSGTLLARTVAVAFSMMAMMI